PRSAVRVSSSRHPGDAPTDASHQAGAPGSLAPTYAVPVAPRLNIRLHYSPTGSFRPVAGNLHLHRYYNFAASLLETVPRSLRLSCGSELTRQGISLP